MLNDGYHIRSFYCVRKSNESWWIIIMNHVHYLAVCLVGAKLVLGGLFFSFIVYLLFHPKEVMADLVTVSQSRTF